MRFLPNLIAACLFCLITTAELQAQNNIPAKQQQIEAAVASAPDNLQQGAKVYGYDQQGGWVTLREGSNELVCIADDPETSNFHVTCYFEGLEPFMKRGRELRAKGLTNNEVNEARREEIKSGELSFPGQPMALYSLSGSEGAYNYETATVVKATPLYVVYVPFATKSSTGISTSPVNGAPWLMEAGQPEAHIMYTGEVIGTATHD